MILTLTASKQRTASNACATCPRVCTGAGFAMIEGPVLLAMIAGRFALETVEEQTPMPVAHLTVRSKDGIWLKLTPRS